MNNEAQKMADLSKQLTNLNDVIKKNVIELGGHQRHIASNIKAMSKHMTKLGSTLSSNRKSLDKAGLGRVYTPETFNNVWRAIDKSSSMNNPKGEDNV